MVAGLIIIIFTIACCPLPAIAQEEWQVEETIIHTQKKLKASRKKQKQLQEQKRRLEQELRPLQQEMVALADEIRRTEIRLSGLEEKLEILEHERRQKQDLLQKRRGELSESLGAMLRLSRTPPEAVIAMPDDLQAILSTAKALGILTDALQSEASSLSQQLRELKTLEQKITVSHDELTSEKVKLEDRQRVMDKKYEKRKKLQEKMFADNLSVSREIAKLSRRSASMKDLIKNIENRRNAKGINGVSGRMEPDAIPHIKPMHSKKLQNNEKYTVSFAASKGKIRLPVAGKISSFFNVTGEENRQHPGITITTRPAAQVVAPFAGEVVFAGDFLDYGLMVIISHSSSYHTLLAGMKRIDCAPGQNLLAGEPLGVMASDGEGELYVELRKRSKPIDPVTWFARN